MSADEYAEKISLLEFEIKELENEAIDPIDYKKLSEEFKKLTGCPILLNTSFNVNGKPIMSYTEDAIQFFKQSDIDILVIGNKIYKK